MMNLIGLILLAVLSGGIVAVSLRIRASASSGRLGLEGDYPTTTGVGTGADGSTIRSVLRQLGN